MTREEIIKIFEENHIAEGNATINATKLAEIFTKHEADLLKEFIEWVKNNTNFLPIVIRILKRECKNFLNERENYERL